MRLASAAVLAQQEPVDTIVGDEPALIQEQQAISQPPDFWLAIVVGVILAVSFALILTHLSLAAGISAVGPFDRRQRAEPKPRREGEGPVMGAVKKTSNLFGVWTLVTATRSRPSSPRAGTSRRKTPSTSSHRSNARDETIAKYEHMKEQVRHRIEDAKSEAFREAKEARKVARNAAWWTFGSAVASAAEAVIGGILSTYT